MAGEIVMKTGDTAPVQRSTLKDATGAAVDLAGATVTFLVSPKSDKMTTWVNAAGSVDQVGDGSDGSKGKVSYAWVVGDTHTAGKILAAYRVTFANGAVQSFPTEAYIPGEFYDALGAA